MIPLRLQFEGFARFTEPQLISFEDLELFAITGPTGAGKTLILDALSFALYGVTARQSRMVDSLISTDRQRLAVDLQFQAASGTYRVVRVMERRASGTVTKSAKLETLEDGKWKRITETDRLTELNAKIIAIVGLDFSAFTRSILLPQGKFDEFLHGEPRQRRELLKELLGLTRVDSMREEAGKRERASGARAEALSAQLEADGLSAAPERRRELKTELAELADTLEATATQLTSRRDGLKEAEEAGQLHAELEQLLQELAKQQENARSAPELRSELDRARQAAALAPLIRHSRQLSSQLEAAQTALLASSSQLPDLEQAKLAAQEQARQAQDGLAAVEPGLSDQLEALQAVLPFARRLQRLGGAPEAVSADPGLFSEEALENLQQLQAGVAALEAAEQREVRARAALDRAAAAAAAAEQEAGRLTGQLAEQLAAGKESGAAVDELRAELARLELHSGELVQTLRNSVVSGGTCPVCGQMVDSLPEHRTGSTDPVRERLTRAEKHHAELQDAYRDARAAVQQQELLATTHRRLEQEQSVELRAAQTEVGSQRDGFAPAGLSGSARAIGLAIGDRLREQLAALAAVVADGSGGHEPEVRIKEIRGQLTELREAQRQADSRLNAAERAWAQASDQQQLRQEAVDSQQASLAAHELELAEQLAAAGFASADDVDQAVRPAARLSELEELLERTTRELARLQDRQLELTRELAGRPDSRAGLAELRSGVRQLETDLQDQRERRGGLQADLRQQEELIGRLQELTEQRRLHEEQHSLWRQLALDLQENRFTDFLLKDLQKRLAHHASRIIRQVTGERFDLHLSEAGEFEVSDAWAGGERRTAKSLSGGETFIVSLALALALSDTAGGGRRLGALFLDEGFGTLDAVTLDSVAAVLESLSGEGRMVGIITHVTELAERLPARLVVSKQSEGSSVYWEE